MLIAALAVIALILLLAAVLSVSDNMIQIEAKKRGIDTQKKNLSLFPNFSDLFGASAPNYASDGTFHHLTKGHDIKLVGEAAGPIKKAAVTRFAVKPRDYRGIAPIPKMEVAVGDEVKAGDALFFDKPNPDIKYVSPVSGEVLEVRRGAKRAITHVVVMADKEQKHKQFRTLNIDNATRADIKDLMMESGLWPLINQRPFDIIADPAVVPENIFISTFSTAPLAPDISSLLDGRAADFQEGIDVLNKLTDGKVYLGMDGRGTEPHAVLTGVQGAERHYFSGKHPAGNVGVQIHHISPITNNAAVWTLDISAVLRIGTLFNAGIYDSRTIVGLTGGQFEDPALLSTYSGASLAELTKGSIKEEGKTRMIIGDVLTGKTIDDDDFLSSGATQVCAIKEGDEYELFGWLLPLKPRPSISKTMPGFLMPGHQYEANTNTHGERRAMVVTGQYDKMLPMDIYPQHLIKAIMTGDIERMEGLGINELSEEDIALAEFACTSKMPLQEILRDGLDMMREQG